MAYLPPAPAAEPIVYFHEIGSALIGALMLAIVILIRRWRGRVERLEQQRNELAVVVMLRTREIRQEKDTVEKQKQQIEQLLVKAQQSNRAKDVFLANMSHEMWTPLHGILGMIDLVLHTELTAEQRECLDLSMASAKSLLALVNDLLNYSKIEAGQVTLECVSFSISKFVEETTASFVIAAHQKQLDFQVQVEPDVPAEMTGDPVRIRQILINLIANAIKFTEEGFIRVSVAQDHETGFVLFSVKDSG